MLSLKKAFSSIHIDFSELSKPFLITLGFVLIAFVWLIRYLMGSEWAVSLFYLFPICMVTWFVGRHAGVVLSIVSAASWLVADLIVIDTFSHSLIPYLNETFRLVVFLIVIFTLSMLKNALKRQKELARTDSLTGIANRRAFMESANVELGRARRFKNPFSVAYMDLDNFKIINDRFGHSAGDAFLRSVAQTLKNNTRIIDVVARLGGDEFILLLPETGADSASEVMSKLRAKLLDLAQRNGPPVTFSIGAITFNTPPSSVDEMVQKSDYLMYSAKQNGKNMINYQVVEE